MNDKLTQIQKLTASARQVMDLYQEEYPEVIMDRDYLPFKITEEWGECLQAYLMYSDRGRQKGMSKEEIHKELGKEFADIFAYLLLFAENEGIDLSQEFANKWGKYIDTQES